MRELGRIALEWEVKPGDVIVTKIHNTVYTILGLSPSRELGYRYVLHCHSSKGGKIFDLHVPKARSRNYPFVSDGRYMILGDSK